MGSISKNNDIYGFKILDVQDLPEMQAQGIFARHKKTGLEVFHLLNDDDENLFAYSFLTPSENSTGVAHILEHSVLCGSKNYPLKDPFIILARQSVKTFLNAMTFPDKTVYPASSMVKADYFNLMAVYGDAVFFPLLEENTFKQEGHRFEFAQDGSVSIQGVVFNEMRGNYSSFDSVAGDWSIRSLLSGSAYDFDSGGDPADIPNLTYEDFCAFHKKWYHPANCKVFLAGNISTEEQLAFLDNKFLQFFESRPESLNFPVIKKIDFPVELKVTAPASEDIDASKQTVLLNWLLPEATNSETLMQANLVAELLLGHDGAILSKALIESKLGEDIAPQTGLETELKNLCFTVGLRGVAKDKTNELKNLVFSTLSQLVKDGFEPEEIQTAIRSIDFANREVRRSSGPFSLVLMRRALRGWMHGKGPYASLRYITAFESVKQSLNDPSFLTKLIETWLLKNQHYSVVTVIPDPLYEKALEKNIAQRISNFEELLTDQKKQEVLKKQELFFEAQKKQDTEEYLSLIPHLTKKDLPPLADVIPQSIKYIGKVPLLVHEQATNGVVYVDIAIPVDGLDAHLYPLLPFYSSVLTNCGLGSLNWSEVSKLTASLFGGLGTILYTSSCVPDLKPLDTLKDPVYGRDYLILRIKVLGDLAEQALPIAFQFLKEAVFTDTERVKNLLLEYKNDLEASLAPAGNQYAIARAACFKGRTKAVDEIWNGLTQVAFIRELAKATKSKQKMHNLIGQLEEIQQRLLSAGMVLNLSSCKEDFETLTKMINQCTQPYRAPYETKLVSDKELHALIRYQDKKDSVHRLELISSALQVGFTAAVIPSVPFDTKEFPAYIVLGQWLSNRVLWEKVRTKGGAYGVFAYPDSLEQIFTFASYRDPKPLKSLQAFYEGLEHMILEPIQEIDLERTITGCYSREIQPRAPVDKGFTAFMRTLYGLTDEHRKRKIEGILSVQPEDLQNCAQKMITEFKTYSGAVFAGKEQFKNIKKIEFSGNIKKFKV